MSAAVRIVEYLRKLERLKEELVGLRANDKVRTQAEIFRLSAIVQKMLALEGDLIWIELEAQGVDKQAVQHELGESLKQLAEMEIPKKITSGLGRSVVEVEFPQYLDLPGPVVRENILSYLTDANDELNLVKAIPSEVQYLSAPLNLIKFKAVFPLLMKKNLLEPIDLMNLCGAHPYIQGFIRQYFEKVLWKDANYNTCFSRNMTITLEQAALALEVSPELVVLPKVSISQCNLATLEVLRRCGKNIVHCDIWLIYSIDRNVMEWIKCYLELLPNLKTLSVGESDWGFTNESLTPPPTPGFFPELPFLKNLVVETGFSLLGQVMLEKYGPQLELIRIFRIGEPGPLEIIPASGTTLSCLSLGGFYTKPGKNMETVVSFLNGIANCPLKQLELGIDSPETFSQKSFRELLTLISNNWGETLERLEIKMERRIQWIMDDLGVTWILNPGFPKLKQLEWSNCCPPWKNREFLLCCPVLEKLECYQPLWKDPIVEEPEPQIEFYLNKERMLRSNVWKLFPNLELVSGRKPRRTVRVSRKECLAY